MLTAPLIALLASAALTVTEARALHGHGMARLSHSKREVPQEHSHSKILDAVRITLNINNPKKIVDPVFGLLGDAAAAAGASDIVPQCIQQETADQAFTNAKVTGDIAAMTNALLFRALERNSGAVGQVSDNCTTVAVNPEIAALHQHQDAAAPGAQAGNTALTLVLAKQIASIGGDPLDALKAGTFAPGKIGDPTARGNTCDDANDPNGCIETLNLRVNDTTAEAIAAAVAGIVPSSGKAQNSDATVTSGVNDCQATVTVTVTVDPTATQSSASATSTTVASSPPAQTDIATSGGVNTFSEAAGLSVNVDFGGCPHAAIGFAQGLDGRTETAFQAVASPFNGHGSADNAKVVVEALCDQLVNNKVCGLTSTSARVIACKAAAQSIVGLPNVGSTADTFNAALGMTTNFASVATVSNTGVTLDGQAAASSATSTSTAAPESSSRSPAEAATATSTAAEASATAAPENSSSGGVITRAEAAALNANVNGVDFGKCPHMAVAFGKFEGRTETSFIPADGNQFNHGSAQGFNIIGTFMCNQLVNACGFTTSSPTFQFCQTILAKTSTLGKIGSTADTWNAGFGITTNFGALEVLDDQGKTLQTGLPLPTRRI